MFINYNIETENTPKALSYKFCINVCVSPYFIGLSPNIMAFGGGPLGWN